MTSSVLPDLDSSKRQLMQIFEDPHLKGVVQHVFAIISELNGISTRLHRVTREKNIFEKKYFTLYQEHVKLKTSKSSKHELDENKIDLENGLSRAENFPIIKTSPKTENNSNSEENTHLTVEIQETLLDIPASPILRKSKNKTSKSNSCNETFESPNKLKLIDKENSHVIAKSYTNVSDNFMVIDELKEECSKKHITPMISKLKKQSRKFSSSSVNRKSLVNLKQSRIHFKNTKSKNTIDISKSNSFLGGVRNLTSEISKKDSEKKPVPSLKFENYSEENIDYIEESPSCISHKQTRIQKHKFSELLITPKVEENIFDDDETILIIPPKNIKKNSKNSITPSEQESNQKQKSLKNNESLLCGFPIKDTSDEIMSNRKKANKNKLPGWSCKKCSDFYSVAFKGNEELIRKKMNECSKHRGRVNPERNNTPPGFWDVNMPQTPTDDENN